MARTNRYDQLCAIASTLDVIGQRWAVLVVRELFLGPRRFTDIAEGLESASSDMVTARLRELEHAGLIERREDRSYSLTAKGYGMATVLASLAAWSLETGALPGGGTPSIDLDRRLLTRVAIAGRLTSSSQGDPTLLVESASRCLAVPEGGIWVCSELPGVGAARADGASSDGASPGAVAATARFAHGALAAFVLEGRRVSDLVDTEQLVAAPDAIGVLARLGDTMALQRQLVSGALGSGIPG